MGKQQELHSNHYLPEQPPKQLQQLRHRGSRTAKNDRREMSRWKGRDAASTCCLSPLKFRTGIRWSTASLMEAVVATADCMTRCSFIPVSLVSLVPEYACVRSVIWGVSWVPRLCVVRCPDAFFGGGLGYGRTRLCTFYCTPTTLCRAFHFYPILRLLVLTLTQARHTSVGATRKSIYVRE